MYRRSMQILTKAILISTIMVTVMASYTNGHDAIANEDDKIQAFVSILPQAYFVERIAGDHAEITVLVGPGQSPATYDPTPHEIAHLSDADVFFKIGVPFEKRLLEKAIKIIPDLYIVDTRKGVTLRSIEEHDHHPEHHSHADGDDPHIWLNPLMVKIQAATICKELKRLRPDLADLFDSNLAEFHDDLDKLDSHMEELMAPYAGRRFYAFHPSYGYFADRYGLKQVAVEIAGKGPGARQLADLIQHAHDDNIRVIFIQAQFATATAEAIAHEIDGEAVTLDPLSRDYLVSMEDMAEKIAEALSHGHNDTVTGEPHDDAGH